MNCVFFILIGFVLCVLKSNACQKETSVSSDNQKIRCFRDKRVEAVKELDNRSKDPDRYVREYAAKGRKYNQ